MGFHINKDLKEFSMMCVKNDIHWIVQSNFQKKLYEANSFAYQITQSKFLKVDFLKNSTVQFSKNKCSKPNKTKQVSENKLHKENGKENFAHSK